MLRVVVLMIMRVMRVMMRVMIMMRAVVEATAWGKVCL